MLPPSPREEMDWDGRTTIRDETGRREKAQRCIFDFCAAAACSAAR